MKHIFWIFIFFFISCHDDNEIKSKLKNERINIKEFIEYSFKFNHDYLILGNQDKLEKLDSTFILDF